jgi:hypothetical protein
VKRVAWISRDELFLDSDSPDHEGLVVRRSDVLGRAILRYQPLKALTAFSTAPQVRRRS